MNYQRICSILGICVLFTCCVWAFSYDRVASATKIDWYIPDPALSVLAEAFNASHREFSVVPIMLSAGAHPNTELLKGIATESFDVVVIPNGSMLAQLVEDGAIIELKTPLQGRGVTRVATSRVADRTRYLGNVYGIPLTVSHLVVFAKAGRMQSVGLDLEVASWTWNDLADWARKASNPEMGQYGIVVDNSIWQVPYTQSGADVINGPYERLELAIEIIDILREPEVHFPNARNGDYRSARNFFWLQNSALTIDSIPKMGISWDDSGAATIPAGGWILLPLPALEPAANSSYVDPQMFVGIPVNSRAKQEALAFLEWLTGPEAARVIVSIQNLPRIPAHGWEDVLPQLEDAYGSNIGKLLMQPVMLGLSSTIHPDGIEYFHKLNSIVQQYFSGRITMERVRELTVQ